MKMRSYLRGTETCLPHAQEYVLIIMIFISLKATELVAVASSEETPEETPCGGSGFSVAFDPLDWVKYSGSKLCCWNYYGNIS